MRERLETLSERLRSGLSRGDDVDALAQMVVDEGAALKRQLREAERAAEPVAVDAGEEQSNKAAGGGWRDVALTFAVVVVAMTVAAFVARWFGSLWLAWVRSPWTKRELPMIFATVTINAIVRSSEKGAERAERERVQLAGEQDTPGQVEAEANDTARPSAVSPTPSGETRFSPGHINRVREKFFETFCAFRLVVGCPLFLVWAEYASRESAERFGTRSQFGFRISLLLALYCSFRFRAEILRVMLPIFIVYYVWLCIGGLTFFVPFYPGRLFLQVVDVLIGLLGADLGAWSVVRGPLMARALRFFASCGLDTLWIMPSPICDGEYFEAYRTAADADSTQAWVATVMALSVDVNDANRASCLAASTSELFSMVISAWGVSYMALSWLFYSTLRKTHAISFLIKWLREGTLDNVESALANRRRILNYAKSNPFRAKLHADPLQFLTAASGTSSAAVEDVAAKDDSPWKMVRAGIARNFNLQGLRKQMQETGVSFGRSLHDRVGERAKSSTCADRVADLAKELKDLHGEPDTYDLLFRKAHIQVDRSCKRKSSVFLQLSEQLLAFPVKRLKNGLSVSFTGEPGVDAGGLTAELLKLVAEEFSHALWSSDEDEGGSSNDNNNNNNAATQQEGEPSGRQERIPPPKLFKVLSDSTLMLASDASADLVHYYALGRCVGIAVLSQTSLPMPLSSAMLKMMVDCEIDCEDVRALDPQYFENRMLSMLGTGGVTFMQSLMDMERIPFVWIDSEGNFGEELCPNGRSLFVDESNKLSYLQLLSEHYVCGDVREQMQIFLTGFHEIVPVALLSKCKIDHVDLALALQGIVEIDVADWFSNTEHPADLDEIWTVGSDKVRTSELIDWFWDHVRSLESEQRARLLQFSTGLSATPVGGFKNLKPRKFNIVIDPVPGHLPTSLTCFATLRIPVSKSKEELGEKLDKICSSKSLYMTFGES